MTTLPSPTTRNRATIPPNAAVSAYHQNLALHLQSMLAGAKAGQPQSLPQPKPLNLTANIGRVHKPKSLSASDRKRSDDSGSGTINSGTDSALNTTQRGSNTTAEAGPSGLSGPSRASSSQSTPSPQLGDTLRTAEEREEEAEDHERLGDLHNLTARPETHQYPIIPPTQPSSGRSRRPSGASEGSSLSYSRPRRLSQAHSSQSHSRDEEHHSAWTAERGRVWHPGPKAFALRLEDLESRSRRGSQVSAGRGLLHKGRSSATGPGSSELDDLQIERKESRVTDYSSNPPRDGYSASLAPEANSHTISHGSTSKVDPSSSASRPVSTRAQPKEDYEARREARLEKKRGEMQSRIYTWSARVQMECSTSANAGPYEFPDIEPTPISPHALSHPTLPPLLSTRPAGAAPPIVPLSNPATYTLGGKQQPLFIIPPTPDVEKPAQRFDIGMSRSGGSVPAAAAAGASGGAGGLRVTKKRSGIGLGIGGGDKNDITERLRALEALMGTLSAAPAAPGAPGMSSGAGAPGDIMFGEISTRRLSAGTGTSPDPNQTPRGNTGPHVASIKRA